MTLGLILTIGKYLFVALIYLFVIVVLRMLIVQISAQSGVAPRRRAARPAAVQRVPQPQPVRRPVQLEPAPVAERPPSAPQPRIARLVVVSTSAANLTSGLSFPLGKSISIGRKSHNNITAQDRYASATHALIINADGNHILRDYHSTNGTLHNGVRIDQEVVLQDGDEITVGATVFRYQA